jgi:hypothetical protein
MSIILDPTDERTPVRRALAPRPSAITGTVALLDINKARGDIMIDQLKRRLSERLPGVQVKSYRKPTPARPAPDDVRRQIMEESDFVIEALAD